MYECTETDSNMFIFVHWYLNNCLIVNFIKSLQIIEYDRFMGVTYEHMQIDVLGR